MAWARRLPPGNVLFPAIVAVAVAVPALHFEVDRWRRDRAVSAHIEAGDRAIASADYELSLVAYARALEIQPTEPDILARRSRARAYVVADRPDTARPEQLADIRYDIAAAIARDPDHAAAYWTARAAVLSRMGDRAGASTALDSALARDPGFAPAHFALAEQDIARGKPDEARRHYEAALERRPNHVGSLLGLASLDLAAGRVDQGIDRLRAALAQRDELSTRVSLVDALVKKGALREALEEAERGVARDPQAAESHHGLGVVYNLLDRLPEAERAFRAALAVRATPDAHIDLAGVLGRQKRSKDALASYKRALREEPKHPVALLGAGMAADEAGLPEEAADHLQKLLSLPSEGPDKERITKLQAMATKRLETIRRTAPPGSAAPAASPASPRYL